MIYIHWIVLVAYTVIAIVAMITVLLEHRQPAKTIAWVLVLSFLPLVGIVLYFFFGRRTRKNRHIWEKSLNQLTKRSMIEFAEQKQLELPEEHKELIQLFVNQNFALPFKNNETNVYVSGYEFFPALLAEISKATHHIHIVSYIIDDDPLGRLLRDALIDKARKGVEVRLLFDDVGSWKTPNRFFEQMREEGIEVHPFMPVRFPAFTGKVNYRNHRKIIVIDGKVGFIGGMNLAQRYVKGHKGIMWRDTHVKISGAAVYGLQRAFLIDWFHADRTLITDRKYYPDTTITPNNNLIQIVTSSPTNVWEELEQGYIKILLSAKRYVYMETPYFLPTEPIFFAMRTAALSGVDVRLMVSLKTDSKLVQMASRSYLTQTIQAGVKVICYEEGFNHTKLLVADDNVATIGSANIDFRSFENNFEANAFFYDKSMAQRIKDIFLTDETKCVPLEKIKEINHKSFIYRLWESVVRLLSPLL
ncbi:cardiolipin synthase [Prevotella intermedia]|uniref:Cardiolipin synthase n=1 Tax=Prevotella intermedia TaxID=28131 RepID=A0A1P8JJS1_PREIN|nr:cardiolipin synthase [Prevotella intermedia]AFJ09215.1 cardiolipin synthetase [Prevotella intermedia 17]APW33986.1 cardiolipin synthase [Prevotella intermedia]PIK20035.1 cardiolipin synthase [Prevotella intermedia]BAR96400.1 cardiolipin synthetase [Prevotella intermedia]